jgi:hypothetical protein
MKNALIWDVKHSSHLAGDTLRLRYSTQPVNAIAAFTAVTMKTIVFWDVTPCDSCKN